MKVIRRVGIIGGGPSGVAAAKALSLEPNQFESIHLFEKREKFGGLWNYNEELKKSTKFDIINGKILEHGNASNLSPIYKHMETNITKDTMKYSEFPMPENYPEYPTRSQICEYLNKYANSIEGVSFHLGNGVKSLRKKNEGIWLLITESGEKFYFDAVIVANGHFDKPALPNTRGIDEWHRLYPDEVTHSKYYIDSTYFKDKNVLVVGNSASGTDLCLQILTQANKIYNSRRDEQSSTIGPVISIPEIKEYNPQKREVTCIDGRIYNGINSIVFCTGYLYDFEFLKSYQDDIITDGKYVKNLYKDIFFAKDPSIAFLAIPKNIVPFPFSESQAAIVSRVFSGRLKIPCFERIKQKLQKPYEGMHTLTFPKDVNYCKQLQEWIDQTNTNGGFQAERWTTEKTQLRSMTKQLKTDRLEVVLKHVINLREIKEPYRIL